MSMKIFTKIVGGGIKNFYACAGKFINWKQFSYLTDAKIEFLLNPEQTLKFC